MRLHIRICPVYLPGGGPGELDLAGIAGEFAVRWFDPSRGGPLLKGSVDRVMGEGRALFGEPPIRPQEDWLAVLRKR
jgi:hypothetical protein